MTQALKNKQKKKVENIHKMSKWYMKQFSISRDAIEWILTWANLKWIMILSIITDSVYLLFIKLNMCLCLSVCIEYYYYYSTKVNGNEFCFILHFFYIQPDKWFIFYLFNHFWFVENGLKWKRNWRLLPGRSISNNFFR